jgi:hypothetical protein
LAALVAALLAPVQSPAQVPDDAVAIVGSQSLTRATFDHWFRIAAISAGDRVPHRYGACRRPHPRQCREEQRGLRDQTMTFLISARWIEGEATLQGITMTGPEVERELARQRRDDFGPEAFRRFLRQSAMTVDDLKYRVRVSRLSDRLRRHVAAAVPPVTGDEVAAYYGAHRARFHIARTRDIRYVHTAYAWRARRAHELLRQGMPWRRVVRLLSVEHRSRMTVARAGTETVLGRAIFGARLHRLVEPVHTVAGYYVFVVTAARPPHLQTLDEARPVIRDVLGTERRDAALSDFSTEFRARWRAATVCRSSFITSSCSNARS